MLVATINVARRDVPRQQMYLPSHSIPLAISSCNNYFLKYIFTKILNERLKNEVILGLFNQHKCKKKPQNIYTYI